MKVVSLRRIGHMTSVKPFQVGVTPESWTILLHFKVTWETVELYKLAIAMLAPVIIITYVTKALPNEPASSS